MACSQKTSSHTPRLGRAIRLKLGARLRSSYADMEGQPLPDDHVDLLLKLRQTERSRRTA